MLRFTGKVNNSPNPQRLAAERSGLERKGDQREKYLNQKAVPVR